MLKNSSLIKQIRVKATHLMKTFRETSIARRDI